MPIKKITTLILLLLLNILIPANAGEITLINKANNGNIQAMLELNKKFNFPTTKKSLALYNKWFPLVLKQDKAEDIADFAEVLKKYEDLFINGKQKYKKLLDTAKEKGSKKALFSLLKFYKKNLQDNDSYEDKYKEIVEEILKDDSKKNLETFKKVAKEINDFKLENKIQDLMIKKTYIYSKKENLKELNEAYEKSKYTGHDKKRLPKIIEKIIVSNSLHDILYAENKIKYRENTH